MRVLLDTNVLSEPLREHPNGFVLEQLQEGTHQLYAASVVIHELAYTIQRLSAGRKRQRLAAYSMVSTSCDGDPQPQRFR